MSYCREEIRKFDELYPRFILKCRNNDSFMKNKECFNFMFTAATVNCGCTELIDKVFLKKLNAVEKTANSDNFFKDLFHCKI